MQILDIFRLNKRRQWWKSGVCDLVLQHEALIDKCVPVYEFNCPRMVEQAKGRERVHKRTEARISKIKL